MGQKYIKNNKCISEIDWKHCRNTMEIFPKYFGNVPEITSSILKFIGNNIIFDTMEIFQKYFGNIK